MFSRFTLTLLTSTLCIACRHARGKISNLCEYECFLLLQAQGQTWSLFSGTLLERTCSLWQLRVSSSLSSLFCCSTGSSFASGKFHKSAHKAQETGSFVWCCIIWPDACNALFNCLLSGRGGLNRRCLLSAQRMKTSPERGRGWKVARRTQTSSPWSTWARYGSSEMKRCGHSTGPTQQSGGCYNSVMLYAVVLFCRCIKQVGSQQWIVSALGFPVVRWDISLAAHSAWTTFSSCWLYDLVLCPSVLACWGWTEQGRPQPSACWPVTLPSLMERPSSTSTGTDIGSWWWCEAEDAPSLFLCFLVCWQRWSESTNWWVTVHSLMPSVIC